MWCWRRMEKISWIDHVRNEDVLLRVNEQRNILHEIRKRKANWICHILRRNCLLKQVIEGKIKGEMEVTRRRGRRRKKLLFDLKDRKGYSHLQEGALDRTMWRNRFGGGFGPVVRQNTEWVNEPANAYRNCCCTTNKQATSSQITLLTSRLSVLLITEIKESRRTRRRGTTWNLVDVRWRLIIKFTLKKLWGCGLVWSG